MSYVNRKIALARRPEGVPQQADFALVEEVVPELEDGQLLVKNSVFALDPATRGFLDDRPSYLPPVQIGEVVRSMAMGEVLQSRNPRFVPGDLVRALVGWEEFSVVSDNALGLETVKVDKALQRSFYMGILGPSGLTAYIGLHGVGKAKPGDTIVVSAAAGAVGNIVGQIAKIHGCRVVGIVGSEAKGELCTSLGFDVVVNYNDGRDLASALAEVLPDGCDVFFDGVGGSTLDAMLPLMAQFSRIVVCGMIANYNDADNPYKIGNLWQVLVKRIRMEGFITYDYPEMIEKAQNDLNRWVIEQKLKPLENRSDGIENTVDAFIRLMSGNTIGKTVVVLD